MATFDINKYIREQGSQEPVGSIMSPDAAEPSDKITDFYKRFSQSIYNAFEDKERFNQTFGPKAVPKQNVDWDEVRRYTRDADMREAIEGSISEALGILQEPTPEPQGVTLVDVTDTEEGKLSNSQPLYDLAESIDPGTIKTKELPPAGGIMSPRLDEKGKGPEKPATPRNADEGFSPIDASISEKTTKFYLDIGQKAESDHGSVPKPTKDKREKNIPEAQRSKDVGFGHKVKDSEDASGMIHGIKFKNDDGTYIALTQEQKVEILNKDMAYELSLARKDSNGKEGWDSKLKKLGITWDDLDYKYQNALTSLAYNVGGIKAGTGWTKVLQAAKDGDVKEFAKQMRRKDSGSFTSGMDNRVAKELYYAGIISSLDEVSSVLPKADYKVAGIPKSGAA